MTKRRDTPSEEARSDSSSRALPVLSLADLCITVTVTHRTGSLAGDRARKSAETPRLATPASSSSLQRPLRAGYVVPRPPDSRGSTGLQATADRSYGQRRWASLPWARRTNGTTAIGLAHRRRSEARKYADHVRLHGILQFLATWERLKARRGDGLLWGDEIEYMVVSLDHENKNARLSLRQSEILSELALDEAEAHKESASSGVVVPTFHPEYGRYMLESTPGAPYGATIKDLLLVEPNMRWRRQIIRRKLKSHEIPITYTSFPRLGVKGVFLDPHHEPNGQASHSLFLPDEIINPHVRFPTLTANIRRRRGSKVAMNVPIFHDRNTPKPFVDPAIPWDRDLFDEDGEAKAGAAKPDHIYMDAMGFGMGCSCLQITFQAWDVSEARRIYDALIPVGPVMLALTAAAPIFRGYLADVDARWNVIAGSVDDRTAEERGLKPLKSDRFVIPKSRYDSVDCYLSQDQMNRPEYNDNPMPIDEDIKGRLLEAGVDDLLASHVAHLFIRDPLVVFSETIDQDDEISSDHFENIQSTNWQTMRFKPPPPGSSIGWRVEFRPMEVQLTDFENAALSVFIVLLTRAIISSRLNFYLPISKVDENMHRAQLRNAVRDQRFFFRKNVFGRRRPESRAGSRGCTPNGSRSASPDLLGPVEDEYGEFTVDEILNGTETFPGLLGVVRRYVDSLSIDVQTRISLDRYLAFIRARAKGELITTATWIRQFVTAHPDYKHDSVVNESINYDLAIALDEIERGVRREDSLLPQTYCGSDQMGKCDGSVA